MFFPSFYCVLEFFYLSHIFICPIKGAVQDRFHCVSYLYDLAYDE